MAGLPLVMVEWNDSHGCPGWTDYDGIINSGSTRVTSVGWLLYDSATHIVLLPHAAQSLKQGFGDLTIPRESIMRMVPLEVPLGWDAPTI